jgi:P27 family predicted phage terminase small subunit
MAGQPGRSGRKPKPLKVLKSEGNRGHRSRLADMVEPIGKGKPVCPQHLTETEKALWMHVLSQAPDVLCGCDEVLVELLVVNLARWRLCNDTIEKSGLLVKTSQGPASNPLIRVANGAANIVRSVASEIGFSPAARARLMRLDDFQPPDDDAFENYVFGSEPLEGYVGPENGRNKRRVNGGHLN